MNEKCTVLINSCDSYEDAWYPFFTLFDKYWSNCDYPIVLNTENKSYELSKNKIKSFHLDPNHSMKWGERLIRTLDKIQSEYIIFLLDDFFFTDMVNDEKISELVKCMDEDKNVGVFSLYYIEKNPFPDQHSKKYSGFDLRNKKGPYRYNCQAAIWRKSVLKKSLRRFESAWDWELIGNRRSRRLKYDFYTLSPDSKLVFQYDYKNIGIVRGYWSLPLTEKYLESQNIFINYSIRNSIIKNKENENEQIKKFILFLKKIRSLI